MRPGCRSRCFSRLVCAGDTIGVFPRLFVEKRGFLPFSCTMLIFRPAWSIFGGPGKAGLGNPPRFPLPIGRFELPWLRLLGRRTPIVEGSRSRWIGDGFVLLPSSGPVFDTGRCHFRIVRRL